MDLDLDPVTAVPRSRVAPANEALPTTDALQEPQGRGLVPSVRQLWLALTILATARLALLPWTPPGFFRDEAAIHAHTKALIATGADAWGNSWPLFSIGPGGGYSSALYLYPSALWESLFGSSEISVRYFSQVLTLAAVAVLAAALRLWLDPRHALMGAVVAVALPWGWLQGSIAWDNALVPLLVTVGFWGFSVLLHSANPVTRRFGVCALPLGMVASAYAYAPCRAFAPLSFALMVGILVKRRAAARSELFGVAVVAVVSALPLAHFMLQPGTNARTAQVSVFSDASLQTGATEALSNFWNLLNPAFLFLNGDPNLRHSTGHQGMLGTISIIPIVALLGYAATRWSQRPQAERSPMERQVLLVVVVACCAAFGLLSSALTAEGQPHSLRATAAWPFVAILVTVGWKVLLERARPAEAMGLCVLFAVATTIYAADLATGYRDRAAEWFDVSTREQIANGQHVDVLDIVGKYYQER